MAGNLPKFEALLKKWPVSSTRKNCYGRHLRELFKKAATYGRPFPGDLEENSKCLDSLLRLSDNKYGKKYLYGKATGSTGLGIEELNVALSDQFIESYNKKLIKF